MFKELEKIKKELNQTREKAISMELHFQEEFRNIAEIAKKDNYSRDDIKLDVIQKIAIKNIEIIYEDLYNSIK